MDGHNIQGKVRQIAPSLQSTTKSGLVYVDLPIGTKIQQGTYVTGTINIGSVTALTIPESSVVNRDGYNYVMLVESNNTILQKKIELGDYVSNYVIVNSGVNSTDKIVVAGAEFLSNGDLVNVDKGNK